jgi:hypothetical protein
LVKITLQFEFYLVNVKSTETLGQVFVVLVENLKKICVIGIEQEFFFTKVF